MVKSSQGRTTTSSTRRSSVQKRTLELDLRILDAGVDDNWTACIDFGTAFSKVVMVQRHKRGTTTIGHVRPLQIGPVASTGFSPLMCPSALYIVQRRIHFGERAFIVFANHGDNTRRLFESPKHYISSLNRQLLETPTDQAEDPTQEFTRAQLLLLLLGFIIHRFDRALQDENILDGCVPRLRIARPAWKHEFEQEGEALLLDLLARAFVLARTIGTQYDTNDGLSVDVATSALELVNRLAKPSQLLKTKLVREAHPSDCIDRGFVPEATAVAAAAIRPEERRRRIFVIADIGAGTSDFGAFVTVPGQEQRGRIGEYTRARRIVERGGNFLDSQLVTYLIGKNGLNPGLPSDVGTIAALKREARRYKEEIFRDQELLGPLQGELSEFVVQPEVKFFVEELRCAFQEALDIACGEAATMDDRPPVRVICTGGGADLPFVRDLARMPPPNFVSVISEDATPPWALTNVWEIVFRQLAVAIGGAMPSLPEQR